MPFGLVPVLLLVLAFEVGLGTGLLGIANPVLAAGISVPVGLLLRRAGGREWLAAAAALGALHGWTARALDQGSCRRGLRDGPIQLEVHLAEPARTGRVEARPLGAGCRGTITLRWPRSSEGAAGDRVAISGRWVSQRSGGGRADGLLLVQDARILSSAPSLADRLRNALSRETAVLYGTRAGLVDALVLGRRSDIEPSLNTAFALSGLVHLLSISGFHVGLIAGWLYLLARLARLRRVPGLLLAAAAATLYVIFIGSPPPAARAAALGVLAANEIARQRNVRPGPLLAVTVLAVTALDPWALLDLGGWLSVAALWGATGFTRWSDRAVGRLAVWRMLFASLGATLATAPLTAAVLGVVAPIGIGLNFVAIPLTAVAVPGILASLVSFPLSGPLARALAAGSGLTLDLVERLAHWGARMPGGAFSFPPGVGPALLWAGLLLGAMWTLGRRNTKAEALRRLAWAVTILLLLTLAGRTALGDAGSQLTLHF